MPNEGTIAESFPVANPGVPRQIIIRRLVAAQIDFPLQSNSRNGVPCAVFIPGKRRVGSQNHPCSRRNVCGNEIGFMQRQKHAGVGVNKRCGFIVRRRETGDQGVVAGHVPQS